MGNGLKADSHFKNKFVKCENIYFCSSNYVVVLQEKKLMRIILRTLGIIVLYLFVENYNKYKHYCYYLKLYNGRRTSNLA